MSINVYDNFLSLKDSKFTIDFCRNSPYYYGEQDIDNVEEDIFNAKYCTGLVHDVYCHINKFSINPNICKVGEENTSIEIFNLFSTTIEEKFPEYKPENVTRLYVNCFAPSENPYFHSDGKTGTTFLYYPNLNWNLDDGGETQFFIDGNLYAVAPIPNRLIYFDANIMHKATTFRDRHRFSIAIKYNITD